MDWPFTYHFKGRPKKFRLTCLVWTAAYLAFALGILQVGADSSPPVADVEDLFKDEGFLRMSRGGEAFAGRRPPPISPIPTQPPRGNYGTQSSGKDKSKGGSVAQQSNLSIISSGDKLTDHVNSRGVNRTISVSVPPSRGNLGIPQIDLDGIGVTPGLAVTPPSGTKPLKKDVDARFSKVGENAGGRDPSSDSDAHPLLGITPAAPGEAFDFNPILSNPAVTRILAGSSGRMPQWEPTMSDFHETAHGSDLNYTSSNPDRGFVPNSNGFGNPGSQVPTGSPGGGAGSGQGQKPLFVPSPVSSKGSGTIYNMDQLTNNIAIPKHTLPNPSNLATSRSTITEDVDGGSDIYSETSHGNGMDSDREDHRYGAGYGSSGPTSDDGRVHDYNEDPVESNPGSDPQGKRGSRKGDDGSVSGQDIYDSRHESGLKAVCDALCGAWKHQCKLMGILFSITGVLCLLFAFAVLYSLQFHLRDFVPFSIILLFLFATSASRAFILLSESFCSPASRPSWLPIVSTLPPGFFTIAILVALRLTRFPFPFIKSYRMSSYVILVISLLALLPSLALSTAAHLHPPSHAILSQAAWISSHIVVALVSMGYLCKFRPFYARVSNDRNGSPPQMNSGAPSNCLTGLNGSTNGNFAMATSSNNHGSKKRAFIVNWGCLQARAMFGVALFVLSLSTMIIISVAMNRGESESSSTWAGWVLSLCARMLEFAIVILLLLITISSADVRFLSRLARVPTNKSNVGLMNADIFPTMVSSNTAVQRCIPMYSSNARQDVMMLGPTESRSSLRGKTFGERALPGERLGEYRSSVGRGLPLRLGNGTLPTQSLPGTPMDGFPQGLRLPEPAPASLLVTKVVFGTPAVSREVNLNHQHENPLLCTGDSKDDHTNNIYASLESVKIASMVNAGSSTGSNHSGSDRVLLSAPRDYIYSISRDLTKTIDSIYDTSRPRSNNLAHTIEALCPPLAHTIDQIGSIPNLNGVHTANRPGHFNIHPHAFYNGNNSAMAPGRTDLARTIDRIRYAASAVPPNCMHTTPNGSHPAAGRNFVLQLGPSPGHHMIGNPPPYCSSESSHDVTPDSGIVSDIHSKCGRGDIPEVVYAREYRPNSIEDIRRVPKQYRTPGSTPLYDRTPTSPMNPSSASSPGMHPGNSPQYMSTPGNRVGRVEHLLNQTESILSRTESVDSNANSAGIQRLMSQKEQLKHVEKLLAQAEYAIMLEKQAQQVVSHPAESPNSYAYSQQNGGNQGGVNSSSSSSSSSKFHSANNNAVIGNANGKLSASVIKGQHTPSNSQSQPSPNTQSAVNGHYGKKMSKQLEEESVV